MLKDKYIIVCKKYLNEWKKKIKIMKIIIT